MFEPEPSETVIYKWGRRTLVALFWITVAFCLLAKILEAYSHSPPHAERGAFFIPSLRTV